MKCPKCNKTLTEYSYTCKNCNYKFSDTELNLMQLYFEIKTQKNRFEILEKNLNNEINLLQNIIDKISLKPIGKKYILPSISKKQKTTKSEKTKYLFTKFEWFIGKNIILFIGILILLFGIGFFLRYSIEKGIIPPSIRLILGYALSALFGFLGYFSHKKEIKNFGNFIIGASIAIFFSVTLAGSELYRIIPTYIAIFLNIIFSFITVYISLLIGSQALAFLSIMGGFLTPHIVNKMLELPLILLIYIIIFDFISMYLWAKKGFIWLSWLAYLGTSTIFMRISRINMLDFNIINENSGYFITFLFLQLFIISIFPPLIKKKELAFNIKLSLLNAYTTSFFMYKLIYYYNIPEIFENLSRDIIFSIFMLINAALFYLTGKLSWELFYYKANSIIFILLGIYFIISSSWFIPFVFLAGILILQGSIKWSDKALKRWAYGIIIFGIIKLLYIDMEKVFTWNSSFMLFNNGFMYKLWGRLISEASLLTSLYFVFKCIGKHEKINKIIFGILSVISIFSITTIEIAGFSQSFFKSVYTKDMMISIAWAILASIFMGYGIIKDIKSLRIIGIITFITVSIKIFLLDMLSTGYKVILFLLVGMSMIIGAYFYNSKKTNK